MIVRRDIVGFSFPFSVGVGLGVVSPLNFNSLFSIISVLLLIISTLLYLYYERDYWILVLAISLLLGYLCGICSNFGTGLSMPVNEKARASLIEAISDIGYQNENATALATALITGDRSFLSKDLTESFRLSGASHILALSGFHFGIIYLILSKVLFWMNYSRFLFTLKSLVIIAFCFFYASLSGASPSIVRAFLFIFFNEILRFFPHRKRCSYSLFCLCLMLQLLLNPRVILSVGFQLSYLAVLGIVLIYPRLKSMWGKENGGLMAKVWNMASLSIAAQSTTSPLVWLRFKSFPIYFLITNLFALPLVSIFITSVLICLVLNLLIDCPLVLIKISEAICLALIKLLEIISRL